MKEKLKKALKALEDAEKKLSDAVKASEVAASGEDVSDEVKAEKAAAVDTAKSEVESKTEELESVNAEAKKAARADEAKAAAKAALEVKVPGALAGTVPATATDHDKEEAARARSFVTYCAKGPDFLSPDERKSIALTDDHRKVFSGAGTDAVVMPRDMVRRVLGPLFAAGVANATQKAIPSTSIAAGFTALIPQDYRDTLLQLPAEMPALLPRTTVLSSPTGTITIPRLVQTDSNEYGGVSVSWISEGAAKPETEMEFEQVTIAANEVAAYTELTHRLLSRSAVGLEQVLNGLFRGAVIDAIDNALLTGSGVGQPQGIVNAAGIRTVQRAAAGGVSYADLVNLKYAVRPYHRAAGIFILEDAVAQALELAVDNDGRPLFTASTANGIYDRLVGKPYITTTRLPALGVEGDVMFGDPRQYYVGMEEDVVVKRSDEYRFRNNVAAFVVFAVVGGQLVQPRTFAMLTDAAS